MWRSYGSIPVDVIRSRLATAALKDGFDELFWIDADIEFDPDDVDRLRAHDHPFVTALYAKKGAREIACNFLPETLSVRFGTGGGLVEVRYCGFGFTRVRREVFEVVQRHLQLPDCDARSGVPLVPFFAPMAVVDSGEFRYLGEDYSFCQRAHQCGIPIIADTTIRLWHVGSYRYGWEDAAGTPRYTDFTLRLLNPPAENTHNDVAVAPPGTDPHDEAMEANQTRILPLLSANGPRLTAYVLTYPANRESLDAMLASFRQCDWGGEPVVVEQPADITPGRLAGSSTYKRVLEKAADDGSDYALILEDDVRVARHLRHNLVTNPLVARGVCNYLGLFIPDLIADPWERIEPHLGYRLARPRIIGPDRLWQKHRVWGSQGYLLSQSLVRACLARWDQLTEGQDSRVLTVCRELAIPLWYTLPCLVQHSPVRSAFNTPPAFAPDFDPEYRLAVSVGFHPPDGVPGLLSVTEGLSLYLLAVGKCVIEVGTGTGQAMVCLAQAAARLLSIDTMTLPQATQWAARFEVSDRVEFAGGGLTTLLNLNEDPFDVAVVDARRFRAQLIAVISATILRLAASGRLAVVGYPDPEFPQVRTAIDGWASQNGWMRVDQVGFVGVFRRVICSNSEAGPCSD
ncbi:MAG: hypothetical protein ACRCZF_25770 [Gemmataceae bacterium]